MQSDLSKLGSFYPELIAIGSVFDSEGAAGIVRVLEIPLAENEKRAVERSAGMLKEVAQNLIRASPAP